MKFKIGDTIKVVKKFGRDYPKEYSDCYNKEFRIISIQVPVDTPYYCIFDGTHYLSFKENEIRFVSRETTHLPDFL